MAAEVRSFSVVAARLAGLSGAILGWRPDTFWRATPAELGGILAAMAPVLADHPPDQHDLARLQEMFPDG